MDAISGFVSGSEAFWLQPRFEAQKNDTLDKPFWIHVTGDADSALYLADVWRFVQPNIPVFVLPNLGSFERQQTIDLETLLPYTQIFAHNALQDPKPALIITTHDGLFRKLPEHWIIHPPQTIKPGTKRPHILNTLERIGFTRCDIVHIPGEYAVRGSLIDVFPVGDHPVRLDFFGDDLESIKSFDPLNQRTTGAEAEFTLGPLHGFAPTPDQASMLQKILLDEDNERAHDALQNLKSTPYQRGISSDIILLWSLIEKMIFWPAHMGVRGISLAACAPSVPTLQNPTAIDTSLKKVSSRLNIANLWCNDETWDDFLRGTPHGQFDATQGHNHVRQQPPLGFKTSPETSRALSDLETLQNHGRVLLVAHSDAGSERWQQFLKTHKKSYQTVGSWQDFQKIPSRTFAITKAAFKDNLKGNTWSIIAEDKFWPYRERRRAARRGEKVLADFTSLNSGDFVTHDDHGIGQYEGLETLNVDGVMHDCLKIIYGGGDRLFVPVENMAALSRYGSDETRPTLDRLGSNAWQTRKARAQKKAVDLAHGLLTTAAKRKLQSATAFHAPSIEDLEAFAKGFPFLETEDQARAIEDTLDDLTKETPMDRLVCGDVGFGKTEVALRAAFVVASSGKQVAVVVPTTLLARQHGRNFKARFAQTGLRVATLSRLTSSKDAKTIKDDLKMGQLNIIVATHALLSDTVRFKDLGLLIIDEEQHFGVAHKEKLKKLKADLHVLTLTATPIPRTLHMALSDLKALSLITTPPVDRKAVITNVAPFRKSILKEALVAEKTRGGQSFIICPRLTHLEKLRSLLTDLLPHFRVSTAHGSLNRQELEQTMSAFEDGDLDVLLSTNIIESGIDITRANTLLVYRADLFGLANLYQLRGRIGRGQTQGVAHLFLDENKTPTPHVQRRLEVMQSLDYLGAGFAVASHDMDIRGTGNLVGSEQSGHIREVGVSYYQKLLCDAMHSLQDHTAPLAPETKISFPESVLLPPSYISALDVRLGIYQRLSGLDTLEAIADMREEWVDRFGPIPPEANNLLAVTELKIAAQAAWVSQIDVGKKATALSFVTPHPHPEKLFQLIHTTSLVCKLGKDQRLIIPRQSDLEQHLKGLHLFLKEVANLNDHKTSGMAP